jgi:hypothetical protein
MCASTDVPCRTSFQPCGISLRSTLTLERRADVCDGSSRQRVRVVVVPQVDRHTAREQARRQAVTCLIRGVHVCRQLHAARQQNIESLGRHGRGWACVSYAVCSTHFTLVIVQKDAAGLWQEHTEFFNNVTVYMATIAAMLQSSCCSHLCLYVAASLAVLAVSPRMCIVSPHRHAHPSSTYAGVECITACATHFNIRAVLARSPRQHAQRWP